MYISHLGVEPQNEYNKPKNIPNIWLFSKKIVKIIITIFTTWYLHSSLWYNQNNTSIKSYIWDWNITQKSNKKEKTELTSIEWSGMNDYFYESINLIWEDLFAKFVLENFPIHNYSLDDESNRGLIVNLVYQGIIDFQRKEWLKIDWIIWPKTFFASEITRSSYYGARILQSLIWKERLIRFLEYNCSLANYEWLEYCITNFQRENSLVETDKKLWEKTFFASEILRNKNDIRIKRSIELVFLHNFLHFLAYSCSISDDYEWLINCIKKYQAEKSLVEDWIVWPRVMDEYSGYPIWNPFKRN